ncbi:hypothetical protein [Nocardiopsis halotolerans]|uniref:hypothetical protein n=1 Tax=Nocardiopsis halotolerans TaxID=124252 RepID=UPI000368DA2A|nr:hypothetical protein [Nocardiopsis halotolerans]
MVSVSAPNPPRTTTAEKGPGPLGRSTLAVKLELLPWSVTFTVMLLPVTVPVTLSGGPGF